MPVSNEERLRRKRAYHRKWRDTIATEEQIASMREKSLDHWRKNREEILRRSREKNANLRDQFPEAYRKRRAKINAAARRRLKERKKVGHKRRRNDKDGQYRRSFGISTDDINKIIQHQQFACPICQVDLRTISPGRVHFDHDHKEGYARGVLCSKCNQAIGLLGDCPFTIEMAHEYVKSARMYRGISMILGIFTKQEMARLKELKSLREAKELVA